MDATWNKFQTALVSAGHVGNLECGFSQYTSFLNGERGVEMHDFTLVWMSDNA